MKIKKKLINISLILGSTTLFAILPMTITACSKNNNSDDDISKIKNVNQEVARINNLQLNLKRSEFKTQEIDYFINNPFSFLNNEVNNWKNNPNFLYSIKITNNSESKQITLSIEVMDKNDNELRATSKDFIFNYKLIDSSESIDQELERINNSIIQLKKTEFTQIELNQIEQTNFKDYLSNIEFKNDIFNYDVIDFSKNDLKFKFKFKIYKSSNSTIFKNSKEFILDYTIKPNIDSSSSDIGQEIERLNKNLKPELIKKDINYQELLDVNKKNLFSKITNVELLDSNKFDYEIYFIAKKNGSKDKEISFNLKVDLKGQETPSEWFDRNFTNTFPMSFNLIPTEKPKYDIQFDYLKNNKVDPVTDGGKYYLSTPGGGTGNNSINISSGQGPTEPSAGVPKNGQLIKGRIYTETEKWQLKNTFSLSFVDYSGGASLGTGWIIDYKLEESGKYPTTWYIATNAHVIQNLKVPNDTISPERFEISNNPKEFYNTNYLQLKTVKDPKLNQDIPEINPFGSEILSVDVPAVNLKTIYIGLDFMKTSPSDFTTGARWQGTEEYADFGIMEVKFKDEEEAKKMTQDYVNDSNRHFKYKKASFLKEEVKKDYYSVLGFPARREHGYDTISYLYTSRGANKENQPIESDTQKLSNLATSPYYNSFVGKTGMFDAALGFAFFGMDYRLAYQLTQWYNSWGLIYPIDYGSLGAGSSGSMMMDKEGYTWGIHFAADPSATTGFTQALYCEGFNYQGKFGSYNLEGYDLIEGGFPNQKTSYKDNLKKLYGSNFKTKLFSNGLN